MTVDPIVKKNMFHDVLSVCTNQEAWGGQSPTWEGTSHSPLAELPWCDKFPCHRWRIWWCLPVKFYQNQILNLLNTHKKVNLEITKLLGETRSALSALRRLPWQHFFAPPSPLPLPARKSVRIPFKTILLKYANIYFICIRLFQKKHQSQTGCSWQQWKTITAS